MWWSLFINYSLCGQNKTTYSSWVTQAVVDVQFVLFHLHECGPTRVAFGKRCHFVPRFKDDQGLCGNKFAAAESLALFNFRWQFKRKCQSRVRSKHLKKSLKGCTSVLSVLIRMKRISTEVQQLISSHENVHISIKRLKKTCDDATISCLQSQMTLIVSLQSCFICDVEICWIERLE